MIVLLDENFPLRLLYALRASGLDAEHIIELDQRGISDAQIIERLKRETLLFLNQDLDFLAIEVDLAATVIISRIPQRLRIEERVRIWLPAIEDMIRAGLRGKCFELYEDGQLVEVERR